MHKNLITTMVAIAALSAAACASEPYGRSYGGPGPRADYARGGCYPGERRGDCSERLRYEQRSNRHYVWRDDHYEPQDTAGAAVAGGIIGFILGAAIAGSNKDRDHYDAHRNDRDWHNRCARAYPGYDSRTGTYVGPDGYRRYCTL